MVIIEYILILVKYFYREINNIFSEFREIPLSAAEYSMNDSAEFRTFQSKLRKKFRNLRKKFQGIQREFT